MNLFHLEIHIHAVCRAMLNNNIIILNHEKILKKVYIISTERFLVYEIVIEFGGGYWWQISFLNARNVIMVTCYHSQEVKIFSSFGNVRTVNIQFIRNRTFRNVVRNFIIRSTISPIIKIKY